MTDLNTQMTPEAMMQAEIERLTRSNEDLSAIIVGRNDVVSTQASRIRLLEDQLRDERIRAEKAERELAELRAQTDALVAAAQAIEAHDAFEPAYLSADLNDKLADLSEALRAYRDSNQAEGVR